MSKSLYDKIKDGIAKSSKGYGKFLRVPDGTKIKIRFLSDFEEGVEVKEHSKWGEVNSVPCVAYHFGKECKHCKDKSSEMRTKMMYCWTVFDYSSKSKKIFRFAVSKISPIKSLADTYSQYKTLLDRDFVISRSGSRFETSYTLIPLDKTKFKYEGRVKPYSKDKIIEEAVETSGEITMEDIEELDDADFDDIKDNDDDVDGNDSSIDDGDIADDDSDNDDANFDDDDDEKPKKKSKKKDDDFDDDDDDEEEEDLGKKSKKENLRKKIKK